MSGDLGGVPATRNRGSGQNFSDLFLGFSKLVFNIGDVGVRRRGVGDPKSAAGGKIFPKIIFFFFKNFDIGNVWGRLLGVGDPKSAVGPKFFRKLFFIFIFFKNFDIGDVRRRRRGVGDPKPGGVGKFFRFFSKLSTSAMFGDVGDPKPGGGGKFFRFKKKHFFVFQNL